jgi:hypothetical protein
MTATWIVIGLSMLRIVLPILVLIGLCEAIGRLDRKRLPGSRRGGEQ